MNFKELRKGMIVLANTIKILPPSRELSLAFTSAEKTMMWSGTYLKYSKSGENPYAKQDGTRKTEKDIEPMFDDTTETFDTKILKQGTIYTVDQMRTYLASQLEELMVYVTIPELSRDIEKNLNQEEIIHINMCIVNIYTNLIEARMWLGMELGRIRDVKVKK